MMKFNPPQRDSEELHCGLQACDLCFPWVSICFLCIVDNKVDISCVWPKRECTEPDNSVEQRWKRSCSHKSIVVNKATTEVNLWQPQHSFALESDPGGRRGLPEGDSHHETMVRKDVGFFLFRHVRWLSCRMLNLRQFYRNTLPALPTLSSYVLKKKKGFISCLMMIWI